MSVSLLLSELTGGRLTHVPARPLYDSRGSLRLGVRCVG